MSVYLLHFDHAIGGNGQFARHYLGFAEPRNLDRRIQHHRDGTSGVKIVEAFARARSTFEVARVWEDGDRSFERYMKNRYKNFRRACPICNPHPTPCKRRAG